MHEQLDPTASPRPASLRKPLAADFHLLRRYFYGLLIAVGAALAQWSIVPFVGSRVPFIFLVFGVAFASFRLGRGPAMIVLIVGAINAVLQFPPIGEFAIAHAADRTAVLLYLLIGMGVSFVGSRVRAIFDKVQINEDSLLQARAQLQRQVADLEQLHELSAKLPSIGTLNEQLSLILRSLAQMHGASLGLVSLYDKSTDRVTVVASLGFSAAALSKLKGVRSSEGACGLACALGRRVVVADTEADPSCEAFRELARAEGFRAVHSTPLISHTGETLGAISVQLPAKNQPTEREMKLADMCARKAAIYIDKAQAETFAQEIDKRFRTVLDASAVPFLILRPVRDSDGTIIDFSWVYTNAAATKVGGRSAAELVGQRIGDLYPGIWNEPGLFDHYVAVAERNEVREFERHSVSAGGWFHIIASPLDGNIAVWFADVTERKRQEHDLRSADRRKDEFLATLAHELRNPLAPIRQAVAAASKPSATDAQKTWCHEVIERQVQHMALLLDDLLDMSRITRGILQLRKQPTALQSLIESAVETARPLIDSKRHSLVIELPAGAVNLDIDPLRMSQVITNLLTNAAKYTNPEGTIRLKASVAAGDLQVQVSDNGIGMAEDELHSVFTMFSQVKSAQERSEGGLGIGLALTKGLLQLHGGTIEASSPGVGEGSLFTVHLPQVVLNADVNAIRKAPETKPILSRRILLADDNQDAAASLAMLLQMDGHEVAIAHDGEEALELFQSFRPDVALLDIGMPRMSGYELAKRIRAGAENSGVLLIATTGWGQDGDRARSSEAGFDHHVTKPLDYTELARLLEPNSHRKRATAVSF